MKITREDVLDWLMKDNTRSVLNYAQEHNVEVGLVWQAITEGSAENV